MRWWVRHFWSRTSWQEYCGRVSRSRQEAAVCDLRDLFHPEILWLQNVTYRKSLALEKDVQMEITSVSGLWLRTQNSDWPLQAALELEVLSDSALSFRVTDRDFGTKYGLESTIVYPTAGARTADLLLTLVSNTSLSLGHSPFVRCQHKHFITDSGNDEEINVKKNVFQGRY